jgi:hypothetical protein
MDGSINIGSSGSVCASFTGLHHGWYTQEISKDYHKNNEKFEAFQKRQLEIHNNPPWAVPKKEHPDSIAVQQVGELPAMIWTFAPAIVMAQRSINDSSANNKKPTFLPVSLLAPRTQTPLWVSDHIRNSDQRLINKLLTRL